MIAFRYLWPVNAPFFFAPAANHIGATAFTFMMDNKAARRAKSPLGRKG
jgi:hypothetical protein